MATVNKDFKVKHGLIVEGTTGTINGEDILTKAQVDIDYIIDQVGGSGVSTNTPNTLVLRDGSGNFAAGTITADLTGDVTGTVSDLSNHNTNDLAEATGPGANLYYTDGRVKDVLVNSTKTNIQISEINGELHITAENGVADSTTDDLAQGTTNKYYADSLVDNHLSGGDGISYSSGTISADLASGGGLHSSLGQTAIDRTTVDTWYDASGAASTAVSNHNTSSGVHGVTGDVVGTSDLQTLTNKTVQGGTLEGTIYLGVDNTNSAYIQTETDSAGNLTVHAGNDLTLSTNSGNIVLNPDGTAYVGSASAGNEIATNSYVDNAVSGLAWKQAVNLLATSNVTVASSVEGLVIDGHPALTTADTGYRLLLTGQSTDSENGIWQTFAGDGTLYIQRTPDADVYSELIGAAVYVMEGTQFGSTSWVQGNHYLTTFAGQDWTQFSGQGSVTAGNGIVVNGLEVSIDTNVVATQTDLSTGLGTKQNTLTAGTNISIANDTVSVTGLMSTDIGDFNTQAVSANNGYWDTLGAASTAEQNANQFTTSELASYTTTANLNSTIDGLGFAYTSEIPTTTDELTEGTFNHYYTDQRAEDAAGNLLANATKSNIQISYNAGTLTITAENGVDDATTDDLTEGLTNLYFTDQRAVSALEAVTPNFTEIDINSVAKQIAATVSAPTGGSQITAYSFAKADYRSAKFLVKTAYGTHTELTEILLTLDSSDNVAITEYATIGTNGAAMSVTADIDGSNVRLRVTPTNNSSTVTVVGTLLA